MGLIQKAISEMRVGIFEGIQGWVKNQIETSGITPEQQVIQGRTRHFQVCGDPRERWSAEERSDLLATSHKLSAAWDQAKKSADEGRANHVTGRKITSAIWSTVVLAGITVWRSGQIAGLGTGAVVVTVLTPLIKVAWDFAMFNMEFMPDSWQEGYTRFDKSLFTPAINAALLVYRAAAILDLGLKQSLQSGLLMMVLPKAVMWLQQKINPTSYGFGSAWEEHGRELADDLTKLVRLRRGLRDYKEEGPKPSFEYWEDITAQADFLQRAIEADTATHGTKMSKAPQEFGQLLAALQQAGHEQEQGHWDGLVALAKNIKAKYLLMQPCGNDVHTLFDKLLGVSDKKRDAILASLPDGTTREEMSQRLREGQQLLKRLESQKALHEALNQGEAIYSKLADEASTETGAQILFDSIEHTLIAEQEFKALGDALDRDLSAPLTDDAKYAHLDLHSLKDRWMNHVQYAQSLARELAILSDHSKNPDNQSKAARRAKILEEQIKIRVQRESVMVLLTRYAAWAANKRAKIDTEFANLGLPEEPAPTERNIKKLRGEVAEAEAQVNTLEASLYQGPKWEQVVSLDLWKNFSVVSEMEATKARLDSDLAKLADDDSKAVKDMRALSEALGKALAALESVQKRVAEADNVDTVRAELMKDDCPEKQAWEALIQFAKHSRQTDKNIWFKTNTGTQVKDICRYILGEDFKQQNPRFQELMADYVELRHRVIDNPMAAQHIPQEEMKLFQSIMAEDLWFIQYDTVVPSYLSQLSTMTDSFEQLASADEADIRHSLLQTQGSLTSTVASFERAVTELRSMTEKRAIPKYEALPPPFTESFFRFLTSEKLSYQVGDEARTTKNALASMEAELKRLQEALKRIRDIAPLELGLRDLELAIQIKEQGGSVVTQKSYEELNTTAMKIAQALKQERDTKGVLSDHSQKVLLGLRELSPRLQALKPAEIIDV